MDEQDCVGLLGATSLAGQCLLSALAQKRCKIFAFSRRPDVPSSDGVEWRCVGNNAAFIERPAIPYWVCVAPIWVLSDYFEMLKAAGARRVVAVSSTSRFSKDNSSDMAERALARRLTDAETRFRAWASESGVEWVILRPTLIYGLGRDKNITEIASFIRRFGFFPLLGKANGLRQPIHAADVAAACFSALRTPCAANRAYNISGGEVLAYRTMVIRIFTALGRRPRLLTVPLWVFRLAVATLRCLPRYRQWSAVMAERMNRDLVFDHAEAVRDLGFNPRAFMPAAEDLPI